MIAWVASALIALLAITMFVIPEVSAATEDSTTDVVSSVFIFLCTMLVFIMSPAIALFYGGMLRKQSMTSIIAQCIGVMAVSGVVWWAVGYSLALTGDGPSSEGSALCSDPDSPSQGRTVASRPTSTCSSRGPSPC